MVVHTCDSHAESGGLLGLTHRARQLIEFWVSDRLCLKIKVNNS